MIRFVKVDIAGIIGQISCHLHSDVFDMSFIGFSAVGVARIETQDDTDSSANNECQQYNNHQQHSFAATLFLLFVSVAIIISIIIIIPISPTPAFQTNVWCSALAIIVSSISAP
jgi:hypothetical protein